MVKLKTKGKEILKLYLARIGREVELFSIRERVDGGIATFSLAPPCPQQIWEWHDYWMHSCCWRWRDRVHPLLQLPFLISLPKTLFLIQDLFNSGLQWTRLSAGRECQAAMLPLPSAVSSNMVMDGLYEARIKAGLNLVDEPLFRLNFFRTFMAQHSLPIEFLVIFTTALLDRKRGKRAKNRTCFVVYTFQRLF